MPAETAFEELKRYVRFDTRDAELLRAFGERAAPQFPRIALEFYDRIREHGDAHDVFTGEDQIQRLQRSLVLWMARVCGGTYDQHYFEQTSQIGRVHVKIGLPQRYMLTAIALIRVALMRIADLEMGRDAAITQEALVRILDLELAIMLQAYKESFADRIRQIESHERAALGNALARAERRYSNAVELASVLILGLDQAGRIQLFNREAERVTGFARDEVMGQPFLSALGVEDPRGTLPEPLAAALTGKSPQQVLEGTLRTRAGKLRDVVWNLAYSGPEPGDNVVLFAVGRDFTEARAMEERARQAEKLAAVGTLAAGLAHEIRNPLNAALLHVAFLRRALEKRPNDEHLLDATRVIADEIKRLADLVTEFLQFARPSALQVMPVSLFKLCESARTRVSAQADAAGVACACDLPSVDLEFDGDRDKLSQAILNLLQNAIEASGPAERGHVVLRARREPRNVLIEVEDDGPGVPRQDAPIFDPFFSTKEGGTGLGLAIAHRIVTDHGGVIDVSSKPGKTSFRITLPLQQTAQGTHE